MSERESKTNDWLFLEKLDDQELTSLAIDYHSEGFSWPMAISRSLVHSAFPQFEAASQIGRYRSRPIFAYLGVLELIDEAEKFIAQGDVLSEEERKVLYQEEPIPIEADIEMFLQDDRNATLLKKDSSAITLLTNRVIDQITDEQNYNPKLKKLLEPNNPNSFEDLEKLPDLSIASPNNAARVRALMDYQRIYNLVTQNQAD